MGRVLITGINGFIGANLSIKLKELGFDVWGIDKSSLDKENVLAVDLLDFKSLDAISVKMPSFSVIIHTAALAHSKSYFDDGFVFEKNVKILKNVLKAFGKEETHHVFLSSVAVYGEDRRNEAVMINDVLSPSTFYGRSKKECERIILSNTKNCDILRLAPVYDEYHLVDVKKRILLPIISHFKMSIIPSPKFSFCNINTLCEKISYVLNRGMDMQQISNVLDPINYCQNKLSSYFSNINIPIPLFLVKPIYVMTYLFPKNKGYKFRCLYWKLFKSNIYENGDALQDDLMRQNDPNNLYNILELKMLKKEL